MAATPFNDQTGAASFIAVRQAGPRCSPSAPRSAGTIGKLLVTNTDTANPVTLSIYHPQRRELQPRRTTSSSTSSSVAASNGVQGTDDIRECAGLILEAGDVGPRRGRLRKLKYNCSGVETDV